MEIIDNQKTQITRKIIAYLFETVEIDNPNGYMANYIGNRLANFYNIPIQVAISLVLNFQYALATNWELKYIDFEEFIDPIYWNSRAFSDEEAKQICKFILRGSHHRRYKFLTSQLEIYVGSYSNFKRSWINGENIKDYHPIYLLMTHHKIYESIISVIKN